jgi:cell division protein FtsI/penicillin-binding protein 2
MGIRVTFLILFFGVLYAALGINLYNIQINKGSNYSAHAAYNLSNSDALIPERGGIYFTDKDGGRIPAVINKESKTIYAAPKDIKDPEGTASILSQEYGINEQELITTLSKEGDPYEPLVERATEEQIGFLEENQIGGVGVKNETIRFYPLGEMASHLLGFSSKADSPIEIGRYGTEFYSDDNLRGIPGMTDGDKLIDPQDGEDVELTIDRNIQAKAETILEGLINDYKAEGGTVIVEDPKTGKILAMTSRPDFDPNNYGEYELSNFMNPALQSIYEPGSIFKIITMSAGIDSGAITPDTTYIDTGEVILNGKAIKNFDGKVYGAINMTRVIEKSVNTGAVFAERAIGQKKFYEYVLKFGFKEKTDIDLPGEIIGSLRPLEKDIRDINYATASFGQGISVTPIGLLRALSAVANGGVMMRPYINETVEPKEVRRVISEDTARQVIGMMVSGVNKAEISSINGYNVAGKTGTAQVPDFNSGGYTDNVINTYIGFAPAYDARFIVLIKIDKPEGSPSAALTVMPAFRDIAQFIINYYEIPPDNIGV